MLKALDRDDEVAETILYHHERPDGDGYYGLSRSEIPRQASILAVAEVFDAMTSSCLRRRLSGEEALHELRAARGRTLDGDCVEALTDKLAPRTRAIPVTPQI